MSQFGPPTFYPPVPINLPGPLPPNVIGSQEIVTTQPGVYQDFFQPNQEILPLATKVGVALEPPVFVPPVTFQLIPP